MLRQQAHGREVEKKSEIMAFYPPILHLFQLIKPLPHYHIIYFLFFSLHNNTHKFTWIKKRTWWSNFVSSNLNAYEQRAYHHCNRHRPRVHPIPFTFTRLWSLTSQWVKHLHSPFITYINSRNTKTPIQKTQTNAAKTTTNDKDSSPTQGKTGATKKVTHTHTRIIV